MSAARLNSAVSSDRLTLAAVTVATVSLAMAKAAVKLAFSARTYLIQVLTSIFIFVSVQAHSFAVKRLLL